LGDISTTTSQTVGVTSVLSVTSDTLDTQTTKAPIFPFSFWIACNILSVDATVPAPETYPVNTFPITAELTSVGFGYVPVSSPPADIPDIVVRYVLVSIISVPLPKDVFTNQSVLRLDSLVIFWEVLTVTVLTVLVSPVENVSADSLLLNVFRSVLDKYPSVEVVACVIPIVPVLVIGQPMIGHVVLILVTVHDPVPKADHHQALFLNSIIPALSRKPYPLTHTTELKFIYLDNQKTSRS